MFENNIMPNDSWKLFLTNPLTLRSLSNTETGLQEAHESFLTVWCSHAFGPGPGRPFNDC